MNTFSTTSIPSTQDCFAIWELLSICMSACLFLQEKYFFLLLPNDQFMQCTLLSRPNQDARWALYPAVLSSIFFTQHPNNRRLVINHGRAERKGRKRHQSSFINNITVHFPSFQLPSSLCLSCLKVTHSFTHTMWAKELKQKYFL